MWFEVLVGPEHGLLDPRRVSAGVAYREADGRFELTGGVASIGRPLVDAYGDFDASATAHEDLDGAIYLTGDVALAGGWRLVGQAIIAGQWGYQLGLSYELGGTE